MFAAAAPFYPSGGLSRAAGQSSIHVLTIPAGVVVDRSPEGRLRVTEANGCRYHLKRVNIATGPETFSLTAGLTNSTEIV